ncbi:phosphoglycerate mutase-like protein [Gyrodon lividus]|nr:phosphoglycerate mutase-like protein [Gyrodon lividus]
MYLLNPAILSLLQVPLSPFNAEQAALEYDVAPGDQHGVRRNDLSNLATLSPYHDAPHVPEVSVDLPDDCTVDQVMLLHRHGSRGPESEQKYVLELVDSLDRARDIIQTAHLPSNLQFLKKGYEYHLIPQELTIVGRQELFDHGVEFALRYPTFSADVVMSSPVQRVVDSSLFFAGGFFGLAAENITFLTVNDLGDPVSWITPWKFCPKYTEEGYHKTASEWANKYAPSIAHRLNELLPGVGLSVDDTRGALYACPFDLAARNESPWCDVLSPRELRELEYEYDILMDGVSGHASRGDPGPLLGAFYIKKLIERFTNTTGDARPLYLEFGHDTSILMPLSTMGLNKDTLPLSPHHMPMHRKFRTSQQAPFAANMVWEKFSCKKSFAGPQIRLLLNRATFPLTICDKSEEDRKYGTCALSEFVKANEYSRSIHYHSESWNATCEHNA